MAANAAADCEKTRCERFGEYLLENSTTVRETAKYFGMSKSTVHKDVTVRLKYEDPVLYERVKKLLQINKAQRHLRGGRRHVCVMPEFTNLPIRKKGRREENE